MSQHNSLAEIICPLLMKLRKPVSWILVFSLTELSDHNLCFYHTFDDWKHVYIRSVVSVYICQILNLPNFERNCFEWNQLIAEINFICAIKKTNQQKQSRKRCSNLPYKTTCDSNKKNVFLNVYL